MSQVVVYAPYKPYVTTAITPGQHDKVRVYCVDREDVKG